MINASYTPVFKDERFSMPNLDATSQTLKLTINFKWLLMISYADYQENQTDSPFLIQLPIHQTPYSYTYPPPKKNPLPPPPPRYFYYAYLSIKPIQTPYIHNVTCVGEPLILWLFIWF